MSNQVVNTKFKGVSQLFLEKNNYRRRYPKDGSRFPFRERFNRIGASLKILKVWNSRRSWSFAHKKELLRKILKLKYFWFSHKFSRFGDIIGLIKRRLMAKNMSIILKNNRHIFQSFLKKSFNLKDLYLVEYLTTISRSMHNFVGSKHYSLSIFFFNNLLKKLRRMITWTYFPNWILYKFEKLILNKKRILKRKVMLQYLLKMFEIRNFSIYTSSYIALLSNFLYGNLFKIVTSLVRLDLQKHAKTNVLVRFKFIGGITMTPNVVLKYLLYKLARLHLPTEMIPKLLYKFSGFLRKTPVELDNKEKFKVNLLGGVYGNKAVKKPVKYDYKFVRAFSPFLKGLLFKCNGRFTRKQDVFAYAF